jgi:multidrug efflux pump subunit AcrA (membrane-fusion protein)
MSTPTAEQSPAIHADGEFPQPRVENTAAPPAAPGTGKRPSRVRRFLRALRTFTVVVILLAGAGAGGTYIVRQRMAASTFLDLGTAVLIADPVPVGSASSGVVSQLLVDENSHVTAGQTLAKVTLSVLAVNPNGTSKAPQVESLKAPISGTVSAVDVAAGGVAQAGQPVVTLYDEGKLTFQAKVTADQLRQLRLGMSASITGPGLAHPIPATLDHVVPRVGGTDPAAPGASRLTVVLVPSPGEMATVTSLVPGLRFHATVDTKTAVGSIPAVNGAR